MEKKITIQGEISFLNIDWHKVTKLLKSISNETNVDIEIKDKIELYEIMVNQKFLYEILIHISGHLGPNKWSKRTIFECR